VAPAFSFRRRLTPPTERGAGDTSPALVKSDLRRARVDTAVLGCTHYPLLARTIAEVLGPEVAIVDSAEAITRSVSTLLGEHGLLRENGGSAARHRTLCTDVPERFRSVAERFLGRPVGEVELVDLAP